MNILFLSLEVFKSINESNMYADILREFTRDGHFVCAISPVERRYKGNTELVNENNSKLLRLKIGNIQKTNLFEKGISTLAVEQQYINGIKKYFSNAKFDLVLYATPPITFCKVIEYIKKRDGAFAYLMLKDIFPQNAVDLGIFDKTGPSWIIYKYFRKKETKLYDLSDKIGCMSLANVEYIHKNNPQVSPEKIEVCPNCIEVIDKSVDEETRNSIRIKYNVALDKRIFVYGGNLGKPQGIPFLIECIESQRDNPRVFFLVVGDGTEYSILEEYAKKQNQENFKLMKRLPKEDYDTLVAACDVGMLFLDHRFTIPNFPSRLLSYMQAKLPVLVCTDPNTDVGKIAEDGEFGWWCESNSVGNLKKVVEKVLQSNLSQMGNNAIEYLKKYYSSKKAYSVIIDSLKEK